MAKDIDSLANEGNMSGPDLFVIEARTERDEIAWDRYVMDHPLAKGYHLIGWRRIIEEAYGHQTFYLMTKDRNEEVQGILPLVFLSSRVFGRFLVSVPFLNYGGILTQKAAARRLLLDAAAAAAEKMGAAHIELRQEGPIELAWPCKKHKVSMRLAIPLDFETLWREFPSKLRSQIRRAQKEGMIVQPGGEALLDDFYQVFSRNMRDLGTPVYGRNFFKTILNHFPKEARIHVVTWKGQPVAAGFLYGFRETLEIIWASSDRRYNHLAPNMLLYNSALEYACREGFRWFDFGRSSLGSGTYRFKAQWGATPIPLHWYYWLKGGGPLPDLSPANAKFRLVVALWQKLPLSVSRWIGPGIVKYIP